MTAPVQFLPLPEVARRVFAKTPGWLYRNRRRLEREHGFPPPAIDRLYDPRAIDLWQRSLIARTQPEAAMPQPANDAGADDLLADRAREIAGDVGDCAKTD